MDAISLLKDDQDKVKKILADGEETTARAEVGRTELFAKLKEEMLIHEEEGEMFKQARQIFSTDELESLGAKMMQLKKLGQQVGAGG